MGVQATLKAFSLLEDPQASVRHELGPFSPVWVWQLMLLGLVTRRRAKA